MSNKMWESLVEHAKTCVLSGKYYIYYSDETRNIGAIFNNIYEFCGLIASGQYYSVDSLNDTQKVGVVCMFLLACTYFYCVSSRLLSIIYSLYYLLFETFV